MVLSQDLSNSVHSERKNGYGYCRRFEALTLVASGLGTKWSYQIFVILRKESNTFEPRMKDKVAAVVDPRLNETWKSRK
jgi:hypothetical protein